MKKVVELTWNDPLLSVQCLLVDDVIPILSPAAYCGFDMCGSQRFT